MRTFNFPDIALRSGKILSSENFLYWDHWVDDEEYGLCDGRLKDMIETLEDMKVHYTDKEILTICWARFIWVSEYRDEHVHTRQEDCSVEAIAESTEADITIFFSEQDNRIEYIENLIKGDRELLAILELTK